MHKLHITPYIVYIVKAQFEQIRLNACALLDSYITDLPVYYVVRLYIATRFSKTYERMQIINLVSHHKHTNADEYKTV